MRAVLRLVAAQHRENRFHFWLGILIAILPATAGILLLGVSGWFITAAALAGLGGVALNIFAPSAIIRALAIVRTAGRYGERVLTHDATFRFLTGLRDKLFAAFLAGGGRGQRSAPVLNRLTLDIAALDTVYLRLVVPIALAITVAAGLLVFWWTVSLAVFLTGLAFLMAWGALAWFSCAYRDRRMARRADAALDAMRVRAVDLVAGRRDLAIYGGLQGAARTVSSADERLAIAEESEENRAIRLTTASTLIGQVFLAAMLAVCIWAASEETFGPAFAVGLLLVVVALPEVFSMLLPGLCKLSRVALAAGRVEALQGTNTENPVPCGSTDQPEKTGTQNPVLSFKNVSFRYPGALRNAVEAISFAIETGEVVAVAGRSGCGKSTVAALAARLVLPGHGQIQLNGRDLCDLNEADFRRRVTVLGQRPYLFNDTVAANLRIANPLASDEELWQALANAALLDRISESGGGLGTVLGEGGVGLSGGEQRRLALARAFLTRPEVFILDEMTEGLDVRTASDVLARFFKYRAGASVLMISHKKLELEAADRVLHLPELSR
ncbi:thiol reductant ABC exporter subunit CydC [Roseibium sp.]|uniref:thiol reductant ABC exporter subunit CydC n=1 Tax=Roseibium sp. TaxID=1936156 RepID=UPI003D0FC857